MKPELFGWTGCPAIDACFHERKDGKLAVYCRACDKAAARMKANRKRARKAKR